MSFLDNLFTTGPAVALKTPTSQIDVSSSAPALDRVLKVTSLEPLQATWELQAENELPVQVDGVLIGTRTAIDLVPGLNVTLDGEDDEPNDRVRITVSATVPPPPASPFPWFGDPNASPNGWDFEPSQIVDPDLAANGWTVRKAGSPYTVLTRVGDVPPYQAGSAPAAGTYQSTLCNGSLIIRTAAADGEVSISKAITVPPEGIQVQAGILESPNGGVGTGLAALGYGNNVNLYAGGYYVAGAQRNAGQRRSFIGTNANHYNGTLLFPEGIPLACAIDIAGDTSANVRVTTVFGGHPGFVNAWALPTLAGPHYITILLAENSSSGVGSKPHSQIFFVRQRPYLTFP